MSNDQGSVRRLLRALSPDRQRGDPRRGPPHRGVHGRELAPGTSEVAARRAEVDGPWPSAELADRVEPSRWSASHPVWWSVAPEPQEFNSSDQNHILDPTEEGDCHGMGLRDRSRVPGEAGLGRRVRPGGGRAARPPVPAPAVHAARRDAARDHRPAEGGGAPAGAVGDPPRPRARRPGLRPAEAGAAERDPRPVAVGADRLRHARRPTPATPRSSPTTARRSRRSATCGRCSTARCSRATR